MYQLFWLAFRSVCKMVLCCRTLNTLKDEIIKVRKNSMVVDNEARKKQRSLRESIAENEVTDLRQKIQVVTLHKLLVLFIVQNVNYVEAAAQECCFPGRFEATSSG